MDHCENHYNLENRLDNIPDTSKLHIHFFGILGFFDWGFMGNDFSRFELIMVFGGSVCVFW